MTERAKPSHLESRFPPISTAGYEPAWLDIEMTSSRLQGNIASILQRVEFIREVLDCFGFEDQPPKVLDCLERYALIVEGVERGLTALQLTLHAEVTRQSEESDDD